MRLGELQAPYKELGDPHNYLSPELRQALLDSHDFLTEEALVPTRDEVAFGALELARIIQRAKRPFSVPRSYDRIAKMSRGGNIPGGPISHVFGFAGRQVLYLSIKSYQEEGTKGSDKIEIGQLPPRDLIEGQRILVADEVCDSGRSLEAAVQILTEGLGEEGLDKIAPSSYEGLKDESAQALMDDLAGGLGAKSVETGVIDYKPALTKTGFEPDYWVWETDRWVVYPDEVLEQLGERSLEREIWFTKNEEQD